MIQKADVEPEAEGIGHEDLFLSLLSKVLLALKYVVSTRSAGYERRLGNHTG